MTTFNLNSRLTRCWAVCLKSSHIRPEKVSKAEISSQALFFQQFHSFVNIISSCLSLERLEDFTLFHTLVYLLSRSWISCSQAGDRPTTPWPLSCESPLCVHSYPNANCDCDIAVDYDPSTFPFTPDQNVGFACSGQERNQINQVYPPQSTTQGEHQALNLLPFWDEQVSSSAYEHVDSDYFISVGNFGNSLNPDWDFQGYSSNEEYLNNFDLRTPDILSTPRFDDEEISASHDYSYDIASSSLSAEQAQPSDTDYQFKCHECPKTFNDKPKFT